jgi:Tfp pilus assembly protein FimT
VNRWRRGYTLALPKFSGLVERNNLTAAREELASAIATARAAAVQKGRNATLYLSGNQLWVTVVTSNAGATATVIPTRSFSTLYNVSVTSTDASITYDMRGFAKLSASGKFTITKGTRRDSVCITAAGQIMPRSCSL